MKFQNRVQAGKLLADELQKYRNSDVIVYALPRGGVVTAYEVAKYLHAPLDLIITRKITHYFSPEYAIAATSENGHVIANRRETAGIDEVWFEDAIYKARQEAARRRKLYLKGRSMKDATNKIAIIVDDGVATGLTLLAAIAEVKSLQPAKIVVAVPVIPRSTAQRIIREVDEIVALMIPLDEVYLGGVGAYYDKFFQVSDEEVIQILNEWENVMKKIKQENPIVRR